MPIARVQLENGKIARFEVPEGTTPEQATEYANQHFASTQPEAPVSDGFKVPSGDYEFPKGIARGAQKQVIGGAQMLNDAYLGITGNQPSAERLKLDELGRQIQAESEAAPITGKVGEMVPGALEMAAVPVSTGVGGGIVNALKTMPKRVIANAGLGGLMSALTPAESARERLGNVGQGALVGALMPEAVGGAMGVARGITPPIKRIVNPNFGAASEIESKFADRSALPLRAPSRGGREDRFPPTTPPPGGMGPVSPTGGEGPPIPRYGRVEGVQPTAGMLTDNSQLLQLEQNARNRAGNGGPDFFGRDQSNQRAIYDALTARADTPGQTLARKAELNATTDPLREEAFNVIRNNANSTELPNFAKPLSDKIYDLTTTPGSRSDPGLNAVARDAMGRLERQPGDAPLDPEDIYNFRKTGIDDRLASKSTDPETNQVKNARRYVMQIKEALDQGMNESSGGKFGDYLSAYKEGIKPIAESEAFGKIVNDFRNKPRLADSVTPAVEPHALRTAVDRRTYKAIGNQPEDILSQQGRETATDAMDVMNSIEKARKGTVSVSGSPTASYLSSLLKGSIIPGSGKVKAALDIMEALGNTRGSRALDEALLNPETGQLQAILDQYHAGTRQKAPSAAAQSLLRALKGAIPTATNR